MWIEWWVEARSRERGATMGTEAANEFLVVALELHGRLRVGEVPRVERAEGWRYAPGMRRQHGVFVCAAVAAAVGAMCASGSVAWSAVPVCHLTPVIIADIGVADYPTVCQVPTDLLPRALRGDYLVGVQGMEKFQTVAPVKPAVGWNAGRYWKGSLEWRFEVIKNAESGEIVSSAWSVTGSFELVIPDHPSLGCSKRRGV